MFGRVFLWSSDESNITCKSLSVLLSFIKWLRRRWSFIWIFTMGQYETASDQNEEEVFLGDELKQPSHGSQQ